MMQYKGYDVEMRTYTYNCGIKRQAFDILLDGKPVKRNVMCMTLVKRIINRMVGDGAENDGD